MCPELAEVLGSYRVTLSMTMMNYLATLSSSSFRSFILRSKSGSFWSMRSSRDPIILNNIDHKKKRD